MTESPIAVTDPPSTRRLAGGEGVALGPADGEAFPGGSLASPILTGRRPTCRAPRSDAAVFAALADEKSLKLPTTQTARDTPTMQARSPIARRLGRPWMRA